MIQLIKLLILFYCLKGELMKKIPNIISVIRILLSFSMLQFLDNKIIFLIIYLICGLSDWLDGYIARRFKCQSKSGAILDSIGDLFMFSAVIFALLIWIKSIPQMLIIGIACVTIIRVINLIIAFIKYHKFATVHTYLNKLTGLILCLYPIEYLLHYSNFLLYPLFIFAFLSAIEECLIHIKYEKLDLNRKGLFNK